MSNFENRKKLHDQFVRYAVRFFRSAGVVVGSLTYHAHCEKHVKEHLKSTKVPSALFLRGQPDLFVMNETADLVFFVEFKTTADATETKIEAIPLLTQLILWEHRGVECLYAVYDVGTGHHHGFWISELPPIERLVVPISWQDAWRDYYCAMFKRRFPFVETLYLSRPLDRERASETPFVVLDCSSFNDWRDRVLDRLGLHYACARRQ